jgi:exodeoxyribonuclease V alpha subunit
LTDRTIEELKIDNELIFKVLLEMDKNSQFGKKIVIEKLHTDNETVVVFDAKLKKDEENVALRIASINCTPWVCPVEEEEAYTFISEVEQETKIILENEQRKAIKASFFRKFLVCTGGPGTGKTTIIQVIARLYDKAKFKVLLVAPTGRAAKRMTEATGYEAKTIHRALEYSYEIGGFRRNQENPIDADIIVIDEASMVDIKLMSKLLSAIKNEARVILIGDINQLPSVGPGSVLRDIIESKVVTVVELKYVFRQAQKSNIVVNAHLINKGIFPKIFKDDKITDFNFINNTNPSDIQKIITDIARNSYFKSKSLMECQVLSPMRKGALGVDTLNQLLQKSLNTSKISVTIGFNTFCLGDKVMQLRNNYQKDVYNGDIGIVERIDNEERVVEVMFGSKRVEYEFFEIDDLTLSYACTIHKSQGSEYDTVIIPVVTQHYIMLARNLLYTAITRGKKKVVIIGSHKAISIAVNNKYVFTGSVNQGGKF